MNVRGARCSDGCEKALTIKSLSTKFKNLNSVRLIRPHVSMDNGGELYQKVDLDPI